MSETNGRRVGRKTLGKLFALGALAGVYCFATVGAAGLMMAASDMSAQARGGGHGGGGHGGGGHGGGGHGGGGHGGGHFSGGHGGGHFAGRGHGGHFWHGRWYGYGVGSCWRWTPDGYIWICG
jgi:hypothetical protein